MLCIRYRRSKTVFFSVLVNTSLQIEWASSIDSNVFLCNFISIRPSVHMKHILVVHVTLFSLTNIMKKQRHIKCNNISIKKLEQRKNVSQIISCKISVNCISRYISIDFISHLLRESYNKHQTIK
jgi:hypothetical protein